jgi:hypothetical protein
MRRVKRHLARFAPRADHEIHCKVFALCGSKPIDLVIFPKLVTCAKCRKKMRRK